LSSKSGPFGGTSKESQQKEETIWILLSESGIQLYSDIGEASAVDDKLIASVDGAAMKVTGCGTP